MEIKKVIVGKFSLKESFLVDIYFYVKLGWGGGLPSLSNL